MRLHCGRAEAEKLGPLRERCKKQAKEISYLEHRYQNAQDEIRHLRSLLCKNQGIILNCTGDADQVDHSSLPCNSPSCIQVKKVLACRFFVVLIFLKILRILVCMAYVSIAWLCLHV